MADILIIEDDPQINGILARIVNSMGHETDQAFDLSEGLQSIRKKIYDVVFLDLTLPDGNGLQILPDILASPASPEVIIVTGTGDQRGAEVAFKHGAWAYVQKPFLIEDVALPFTRALQYREEKRAGERPKLLVRDGIIGYSSAIRACFGLVAQAAVTDASVLITGETGTGKELFARAIHNNSQRADNNFVVVDCTALPEHLVESTLFGHEKGSFTGANRASIGLVRQADGGTLFLDEIGELPLSIQKSFLRVLQEHRFRPVGGQQEVNSKFRLVAATNRDLDAMVRDGHFRHDLLFRLRSLHLHLPPLRERKEDIKDLLLHQIVKAQKAYNMEVKGFSPEFLEALTDYDWPGNVRELVNAIDHALASAGDSPTLYPKHLPTHFRLQDIDDGDEPEDVSSEAPVHTSLPNLGNNLPLLKNYRDEAIAKAEAIYLVELMRQTRGKIKEACDISGLSESRLHALLKKYDTPRFRS